MEIKRICEAMSMTTRRFVIRQTPSVNQTTCAECGGAMLPIAQAAVLLGIKQSQIFQTVETGAVHSTEAEAGALMICLPSLAIALEIAEKMKGDKGLSHNSQLKKNKMEI